jgi:hypothetical protein
MNIDRRVCLRANSLHRFEKRCSGLRESAPKRIITAADSSSPTEHADRPVAAGGYGADDTDLHTGIVCAYGHCSLQSSTALLWQG